MSWASIEEADWNWSDSVPNTERQRPFDMIWSVFPFPCFSVDVTDDFILLYSLAPCIYSRQWSSVNSDTVVFMDHDFPSLAGMLLLSCHIHSETLSMVLIGEARSNTRWIENELGAWHSDTLAFEAKSRTLAFTVEKEWHEFDSKK